MTVATLSLVDRPEQVDAGQSGIDTAVLCGLLRRALQEQASDALCVGCADRSCAQPREARQHEERRRFHLKVGDALAPQLLREVRIANWERAPVSYTHLTLPTNR